MNPPRIIALCLLAAYLALGGACFGQTIRTLGYNTTNYTVIGPTNTNALTFTNSIAAFEIRLAADGENDSKAANESGALALYGSDGLSATLTASLISLRAPISWDGAGAATNATTTRSNLFGARGIASIRLTNAGTVYVFTNGILASTNAP